MRRFANPTMEAAAEAASPPRRALAAARWREPRRTLRKPASKRIAYASFNAHVQRAYRRKLNAQSHRSAADGSIEAARRAGIRQAMPATSIRMAGAATKDAKSIGATPNSAPRMKRVSAAA